MSAVAVLLIAPVAAQAFEEPSGPFGIDSFTTTVSTTQAGAHPDIGTSIRFASHLNPEGFLKPNEGPQNLTVNIPPGVIGNLTAVPACAITVFETDAERFACPAATQVGTATQLFSGRGFENVPVVLLAHGASQVARLGIEGILPVVVDIALRTDGDYGVVASTKTIPPASVFGVGLLIWGVPAQHKRGCQTVAESVSGGVPTIACVAGTAPSPPSQWQPFLTNPTTCATGPLTTTLSVNSYQHPQHYITASSMQPAPTNCAALAFNPSITLTPATGQADAPSGYTFDLSVPQNNDPNGFASSQLRKAVVTLPPGVTLNPSVATGLEACSDEQFGKGAASPPSCPSASVVGSSEVISPDVPEPLRGQIYVGQPEPGKTYRVFQNLEGDGLDVKLEGTAVPDPVTGQITATFDSLPQLPFSDATLHFRGGNTAPLANPPVCGQSTTTSDLTPWSGNADATPSSAFAVSFDGLGGPCPAMFPFAPQFSAGSNSLMAGARTTFSLTLARADRTQYLGGLSTHLPPGLVGNLTAVPLCAAAQAGAGTCSSASAIGTISTESGAGETPFTLPGTVYLAQPRIPNSPASLSVVVPAIAGPYNLGNVVVGADIKVNNDGSVVVNSDPFPTILDGVPLRIRQVGLDVTRPGFMLNPTSCAPMSINATIVSTHGQSASASSPFQLADCQSLPFSPKFTVSTQAKTSKANGASLDVKVTAGSGQANIAKVDVALPKQLPSRLTTLQKACTEVQFAVNPAGCPAASIVGIATAVTPVLNLPLTGPAYLVSHGAAAFPDLVIVLQGQGITIELTGNTDIKKGVTYSKFDAVPDVPVTTFELKLPEGPYSTLSAYLPAKANGSMCGQALTMPTTITGQNGAQIIQQTKIAITGCANGKPSVRVTKATLRGNSLLVAINTTAEGTVTVSGTGLKTTTQRNLKAGARQLQAPLTHAGKLLQGQHKKIRVRARLTAGKLTAATTTSVKL
jgi:hypothetical protein